MLEDMEIIGLDPEVEAPNDFELIQSNSKGRMDYVYILGPTKKRRYFIIVEVKKGPAMEGVPQSILAMHRSGVIDRFENPVYGMATNGNEFVMLKREKGKEGKWLLSYSIANTMDNVTDREKWLKGNGPVVVKWIFSRLMFQVQKAIQQE